MSNLDGTNKPESLENKAIEPEKCETQESFAQTLENRADQLKDETENSTWANDYADKLSEERSPEEILKLKEEAGDLSEKSEAFEDACFGDHEGMSDEARAEMIGEAKENWESAQVTDHIYDMALERLGYDPNEAQQANATEQSETTEHPKAEPEVEEKPLSDEDIEAAFKQAEAEETNEDKLSWGEKLITGLAAFAIGMIMGDAVVQDELAMSMNPAVDQDVVETLEKQDEKDSDFAGGWADAQKEKYEKTDENGALETLANRDDVTIGLDPSENDNPAFRGIDEANGVSYEFHLPENYLDGSPYQVNVRITPIDDDKKV